MDEIYFLRWPTFYSPVMSDALVQLKAVFPLSDAVLQQRLEAYGYDVQVTMESLCDDPIANEGTDVLAVVNDEKDIITFGSLLLNGKVNENTSRMPLAIEHKSRLHVDIKNGDCVFYCLYLILTRLVTFSLSAPCSPKELATIVRAPIIQYIEDHWTGHSIIAGMPWWKVIKLTHHEGIPEWEKDEYNGDWGFTAEDSLIGWKKVRDDLYGSDAEMTAFVEMMWQYGIPLAIRVWRKNDNDELICSSKIKHHFINPDSCYVGDILHSGKLDSGQAHCQLMRSASFQTAIFVAEEEEDKKPSKRKKKDDKKPSKRKKKDDDPDYEPNKKQINKSTKKTESKTAPKKDRNRRGATDTPMN